MQSSKRLSGKTREQVNLLRHNSTRVALFTLLYFSEGAPIGERFQRPLAGRAAVERDVARTRLRADFSGGLRSRGRAGRTLPG